MVARWVAIAFTFVLFVDLTRRIASAGHVAIWGDLLGVRKQNVFSNRLWADTFEQECDLLRYGIYHLHGDEVVKESA